MTHAVLFGFLAGAGCQATEMQGADWCEAAGQSEPGSQRASCSPAPPFWLTQAHHHTLEKLAQGAHDKTWAGSGLLHLRVRFRTARTTRRTSACSKRWCRMQMMQALLRPHTTPATHILCLWLALAAGGIHLGLAAASEASSFSLSQHRHFLVEACYALSLPHPTTQA